MRYIMIPPNYITIASSYMYSQHALREKVTFLPVTMVTKCSIKYQNCKCSIGFTIQFELKWPPMKVEAERTSTPKETNRKALQTVFIFMSKRKLFTMPVSRQ